MKTVVILSTDNLGMTVADMLNPREMKLVGMGDTRQETWNVFSDLEKGELKEEIEGMPIMPADLAVALQPGHRGHGFRKKPCPGIHGHPRRISERHCFHPGPA